MFPPASISARAGRHQAGGVIFLDDQRPAARRGELGAAQYRRDPDQGTAAKRRVLCPDLFLKAWNPRASAGQLVVVCNG
jgi:hypothetical protein